ncbi:MAG: branched-chain amino acid ABC transporter permease [Lachnospiraceae bacterium]|nr:branched-chain amino acid ABC transporter permease [Lachnospiraceae bacterium]
MKFKDRIDVDLLLYLAIIVVSAIALVFLDMNKFEYNYAISIIEKSLVYAVVALSMNIVTGFTGLFSLGQAGFMALGAYTTAILTIPANVRPNVYYMNGILPALENAVVPIPVALILGGVVAAVFAALIGIPVLKLKSDYLAIATLGFSEIIRAVIASPMMDKITNGSYGLKSIPGFKSSLECFAYSLVLIIIMILIINSSTGRDFKAIREDEIAARSVGINIFKTKELSFVVSSFFTGVGGGLLAMFMRSIDSKTFSITLTYDILLIVVLGGIGSITGSIVGAFFVTAGKELLRFFDEPFAIAGVEIPLFKPGFRMVIFSILLMVVVLFFRKGLIGGRELSFNEFIMLKKAKKSQDIRKEGKA